MNRGRVVITGMAVNTVLGDTLDGFLESLLQGRPGITRWRSVDTGKIYSKVGGDLSGYDLLAKASTYRDRIPPEVFSKFQKYVGKSTFSVGLTLGVALEAFLDAGLAPGLGTVHEVATIVAGHNLMNKYCYVNYDSFMEDPDFIDGLMGLNGIDTHHVGMVTDLLQLHGPAYTVGGACASGNIGLRCAVDEIRWHGLPMAAVVAPILDHPALDLQGMAVMGAISIKAFNDDPARASRPYDIRREGFVPSHGAATLVLEDLDHALARGARIHAEVLGVEASADGCHLPQPSREGQARLMTRLLDSCGVRPEEVDFICAHATSTPLGDLTEIRSIKDVFGKHAYALKLNAPKSMLGHTCWSSALVETVAAVLQMNKGELHPSINIDELDPEVDLDVCRGGRQTHDVRILLNNAFGFGGLNGIGLIRKWQDRP